MKKLIAISFIILTFCTISPIYAVDQCVDQYAAGEPYIVYTGSNLNCPFVDWGLVNYFQHIVPFPADIQNIEYYATVHLNGATGCIDLRVVIENNYGAAQYFNNVTDGQQIVINVPRSYFENTNFDGCSSNWFVHTADLGWQFQQCGGGWLGSSIISSPKPGCNLNLNTCCPGSNCCTPTAITLSSFTAQPGNGSVTVNWVTEAEIDMSGFNIWRSEAENGDYSQSNGSTISAKGFPFQGATYEFIDTNVQNGKTYFYKLEAIDMGGNVSFYGPVSVTQNGQPPANDDFDNATAITALPFQETINTSEATSAADDPTDCYETNVSVWYKLTSVTDIQLRVAAVSADYNTVLAVYTGTRGNLNLVDCRDYPPCFDLDVRAGETYYFMVTSYYGGGGNLVINVDVAPPPPPPLTIDIKVDPIDFVNNGITTVSGTVNSSVPANGYFNVQVRQKAGRVFITGYSSISFNTTDGVARWTMEIPGDIGLFLPGKATVRVTEGYGCSYYDLCSGYSQCAQIPEVSTTVHLRNEKK
jgi:hypothetical protein